MIEDLFEIGYWVGEDFQNTYYIKNLKSKRVLENLCFWKKIFLNVYLFLILLN